VPRSGIGLDELLGGRLVTDKPDVGVHPNGLMHEQAYLLKVLSPGWLVYARHEIGQLQGELGELELVEAGVPGRVNELQAAASTLPVQKAYHLAQGA